MPQKVNEKLLSDVSYGWNVLRGLQIITVSHAVLFLTNVLWLHSLWRLMARPVTLGGD